MTAYDGATSGNAHPRCAVKCSARCLRENGTKCLKKRPRDRAGETGDTNQTGVKTIANCILRRVER